MHPLTTLVLELAAPEGRAWFEARVRELGGTSGTSRLRSTFAQARRRLGEQPVEPSAAQLEHLLCAGIEPPRGGSLAELARVALLHVALELLPAERHLGLLRTLYTTGDTDERRAVLRALAGLPDPIRFLELGIEACRTNVVPVFDAIACENSFPEHYFPEAAFNQLVMKAVFLGLPLARVRGLETRTQGELIRMARDYAAERRAAGRSIPSDLERIPGYPNHASSAGAVHAPSTRARGVSR